MSARRTGCRAAAAVGVPGLLLAVSLACDGRGSPSGPPEPGARGPAGPTWELPLAELGHGRRNGRFAPLSPGPGGGRAGDIVQAPDSVLELFFWPPAASRLVLEGGATDGALRVSAAAEGGAELEADLGGGAPWQVPLDRVAERPVRLRLANRSDRPRRWRRPRLRADLRPAPPILASTPSADEPPPDVLLYVVDTLRADRLSLYGYGRPTSPELEELARRSHVFERAYAPGPHTVPSITSLFASRYPSELSGRLSPGGPARRTLAEAFREAGYRTAAFQANPLLFRSHGYARGFETYRTVRGHGSRLARAEALHERVWKWLRSRPDGPFFLYVQSMDAHFPYDPPPEYARRFGAPDPAAGRDALLEGLTPEQRRAVRGVPTEVLRRSMWASPDRYDAAVAYADAEIGALLDRLREAGLDGRTVVAVTADHGEPLGQRGELRHGLSLHEELVHVPLILRLPGQREPRRLDEVVSLLDLGPTLLDLAGVPIPESFEGRSWLRPRDPGSPPLAVGARLEFRTNRPLGWFVRQGPWKLLLDADGAELFHLASDPLETTDVSERHPIAAGYLETELRRRSPAFARASPEPVALDEGLSEEERRKLDEALRALGYTQ